jgi:hypothetical protein
MDRRMHTRSLRLALLGSLGLVPLGCARGDAVNGLQSHSSDASVDPDDVGASPTLAACRESTPWPAEKLGRGLAIVGRAEPLRMGVFTGIERCDDEVLHRPVPISCSSALPRPLPPVAEAGTTGDAGSGPSQVQYLYGEVRDDLCQADADCTERPHGYCAPGLIGGLRPGLSL